LNDHGCIKLADFGFSIIDLGKCSSFVGTVDYMSPEILIKKMYSFEVDWWALGVLIYEIMSGQGLTPFRKTMLDSDQDVYKRILNYEVIWNDSITGSVRELIQSIFKRNGAGIKGAIAIKAAKWFNERPKIDWKMDEDSVSAIYVSFGVEVNQRVDAECERHFNDF
jgi:serine/threonine protein kinase